MGDGRGASPDWIAALAASGVVGAWTLDHWRGRLALSDPLAALLGLATDPAGSGVPLPRFLARVHPDDQLRVESYLHAAGEAGGPVEVEFRTWDGAGGERILRLRGWAGRAPLQAGLATGLALDVTEGEAASLRGPDRAVNRMAEHVTALRRLADALSRPQVTRLVDDLVLAVGQELARHLPRPTDGPRH